MRFIICNLFILLLLSACDLGETPIEPFKRGDVNTKQIDMGVNYELQAYFDLGTNSFVKTHYKYDWELAFGMSDSANHIYLNSALFMRAIVLNETNFHVEPNYDPLELGFDHHQWIPDSLALKGLINSDKIAVIDLGITAEGEKRGFKKIKVNYNPDSKTYHLKTANLDGSALLNLEIVKQDDYNTAEVSLIVGIVYQISPPKLDYDLFFGQYTYQFYNPYLPYLVMGVTINPYNTLVAVDRKSNFSDIDLNYVDKLKFSNKRDAIGYDWKYFDLDQSTFQVFPEIIYIIKDAEGFYYKLHFIDFYDETGAKGIPKFEFQRI